VLRAAQAFRDEAARCGVPADNALEIARDIERRIERMSAA